MFKFLLVINLSLVALLALAAIIGAIACKFNCNKLSDRIYNICDGIVTTVCIFYLLEVFVLFSTIVFEVVKGAISG